MRLSSIIFVYLLLFSVPAQALETVRVADGVFAIVGEKAQRSPSNLANNATFGLVVTADGVVLIDPGGSWKGAEALHTAIRTITNKPVRYVINTGGQDHRWLGNGYWRAQGAKIIAAEAAVRDQKDRGSLQFTMLDQLLGEALAGTEPAYADIAFKAKYTFTLGGEAFEIRNPAHAHTPGDSFVWLPSKAIMFSGDIVFVERLLGVIPSSSSRGWVEAFEAMADLKPAHIIPGHGHPASLGQARAATYDYLKNLREQIGAHIEAGGDMIGSVEVDQAAFAHLELFDTLARRNAQAVFAEMEFE